jgi:Helix-turn-helix domain
MPNDDKSASQFFPGEPPRQRINPWRMFIGAMIPNWLLCRRELSQGSKLCYARLCQHAGEKGYCWPAQDTLAAELGVGERQVRTYLHELSEFQLIYAEQRGLKKSNRYFFLDHDWIHENQPKTPRVAGLERRNASFQERQNSADKKNHQEWNHGKRKINEEEERENCVWSSSSGSSANGSWPVELALSEAQRRRKIPRSEFTRSELKAQMKSVATARKAHRLHLKWPKGQCSEEEQHKVFQEWLKLGAQSPAQERNEYQKLNDRYTLIRRQLSGRLWRSPE